MSYEQMEYEYYWDLHVQQQRELDDYNMRCNYASGDVLEGRKTVDEVLTEYNLDVESLASCCAYWLNVFPPEDSE